MRLQIENFMQVRSADINLPEGITFLGGDNGQGKSSALLALAALITGEGMLFDDLKKKDGKLLVNNKPTAKGEPSKSAIASLIWEADDHRQAGGNAAKYPSCKVESIEKGEKPTKLSSAYAAGIKEPCRVPAHELTKLLNVLPTKEQFTAELEPIALECDILEVIESVWKKIETDGWDKAHDHAVARRQSLKQEWARVAGLPWVGDSAAGEWKPEHYVAKPLDELESALKAEEKIFEYALKAEALNEREREDLQKVAGAEKEINAEIKASESAIEKYAIEIGKAESLLAQLPKILNADQVYHCWKCETPNSLVDGKMVEPAREWTQDEQNAAQTRRDDQIRLIDELKEAKSMSSHTLQSSQKRLNECKAAQKKLNGDSATLDIPCEVSVDEARARVELCRKQIAAVNTSLECDEIFNSHFVSDYLCSVLTPDGLRKIVLGTKLQEFNDLLSVICENAEWPAIVVDENLSFSFGGYPYVLLSKGQKFAVNAALQITFAKLDGSQILIFDGIDIMGKELRSGFLNLLLDIPLRSVVACRYDSPSEVPDVEELNSYWCADGMVMPMKSLSFDASLAETNRKHAQPLQELANEKAVPVSGGLRQ